MVLAPSIQFSAFKEAPPSPEPSVLLWEHPTPNLSSPLHLLSRCRFPGSLLKLLLAQCLPRVPSNGTHGIAPRAGQSQGHWTTHYLNKVQVWHSLAVCISTSAPQELGALRTTLKCFLLVTT